MKTKLKQAYMRTAETFAELSHARRLHEIGRAHV